MNQPLVVTARVIPDPKNQYATLIITSAESDRTSLDDFTITPEQAELLKRFEP